MKILFVCTGNTCRSPMALGLFRLLVQQKDTAGRSILDSAGLSAAEGLPASKNAILVCQELGIDISSHQARRISGSELDLWDTFFTMSRTHAYILEQAGAPSQKIYVPSYIEDPFGQDLDAYRRCRNKLAEQLELFYQQTAAPFLRLES